MKALLVTVGGSSEPIVTAANSLAPDKIVFICSDGLKASRLQVIGEGTPCDIRDRTGVVIRSLPCIVKQLRLGDRFTEESDLLQVPADDLGEAYQLISHKIRELQGQGYKILADYTGGTKTMSGALVSAGLDADITLHVTTGVRMDLVRVTRAEATELSSTEPIHLERFLRGSLVTFLADCDYSAAVKGLGHLLQTHRLSRETRERTRAILAWCKALEAWDRFDHEESLGLLESYRRHERVRELISVLERILASRHKLQQLPMSSRARISGYEILEDLLNNADRRVRQQRFDDAVGRLYRALELLVQLRLYLLHNLQTAKIPFGIVPESISKDQRPESDGTLKLGLFQSYGLLIEKGDEVIAPLFLECKGDLLNALQIRNASLFAHGFKPINAACYAEFEQVVGVFLKKALELIGPINPLSPMPGDVPDFWQPA